MRFSGLFLLPAILTMGLPAALAQTNSGPRWVGSWASSQQLPEPANAIAPEALTEATIRQVVRLSTGGAEVRLHLSNGFGTKPLKIDGVHVARAVGEGKIDATTDTPVLFGGHAEVVIPAGAEYISDGVKLNVAPLNDLSVTLRMKDAPEHETCHVGSRATSYFAHGAELSAVELSGAQKIAHWCFLAGVDVASGKRAFAVVALGDSITDGHASTTDGNDRWTDALVQRLQAQAKTRQVSVLNEGIGGNHMLTDGLGPNVLARLDRDVLVQPGVHTVILLEGINDLGALSREGETTPEQHAALVDRIIGSYEQVVERAHEHGIKVLGGTITPDVGSDYYHPAPANEADRVKINAWIRTPGHFDGVVDFDKAVMDPAHPERLLPGYDSGDHLHPSPAGYKAMAAAVSLGMLE